MHLCAIRLTNFRRFVDALIDLDEDLSIFVGANNSGKTSIAEAIRLFLGARADRFSVHDISASRWADIDAVEHGVDGSTLPALSLDLWFNVDPGNLHRVVELLPGLSWMGGEVGIRVELAVRDQAATLAGFREQHAAAQPPDGEDVPAGYVASPCDLREFLTKHLSREYEIRHYVLDRAHVDDELMPLDGYVPIRLQRDGGRGGREVLASLIQVDFLHAQRHLSDAAGGGRAEELSRHLGRFYERNLEKWSHDHGTAQALDRSRVALDEHLAKVFDTMLKSLATLGYPGVANPQLVIRTALNPATVLGGHDGAQVHYSLGGGLTLPDKYSGLGFKNLVYMVVELLDLHRRWLDTEIARPPLHLLFVEEPEAHLHAQLQQVFVGKVQGLLRETDGGPAHSQMVLTTHSPHITYERGFRPIRYFRRDGVGIDQHTTVLNLSSFYRRSDRADRDFLERYMKLTHCDLFFADAAVLVEGNVERLLMPLMIEKAAPGLQSAYLCVLEIGGAHGHRFRKLVEFLCIDVLIVTDLDSVARTTGTSDDDDLAEALPSSARRQACETHVDGATTSNQVLRQWHPCKESIAELLDVPLEQRIIQHTESEAPCACIAYPGKVMFGTCDPPWEQAGRTLEEAFAFENFEWTQDRANRELGLCVGASGTVSEIATRIHHKIQRSSFKKTDFALTLLTLPSDDWQVPTYIKEGLCWLEGRLERTESAVALTATLPG